MLFVVVLVILFSQIYSQTNKHDSTRQLLVLAPPSPYDPYYAAKYNQLVPFYINFVKSVIGKDNVILVADKYTMKNFTGKLPEDVLLTDDIEDPWMRDPSPAIPSRSIQFKYVGGLPARTAAKIQKTYNKFAKKYGIQKTQTKFYLDAGNVVDNNKDKAVVTERFLEDNYDLTDYNFDRVYIKGKREFLAATGLRQLAIIEPDEEKLAHADGMVSFLNTNILAVNEYYEPERSRILEELKYSLPGTKIVEVPNNPSEEVFSGGFASSCGIYVNSVVTNKYIYMPTFNNRMDKQAQKVLSANSGGKPVIPIDATAACEMGGSLRCLSWQAQGENARKLIEAARNNP